MPVSFNFDKVGSKHGRSTSKWVVAFAMRAVCELMKTSIGRVTIGRNFDGKFDELSFLGKRGVDGEGKEQICDERKLMRVRHGRSGAEGRPEENDEKA